MLTDWFLLGLALTGYQWEAPWLSQSAVPRHVKQRGQETGYRDTEAAVSPVFTQASVSSAGKTTASLLHLIRADSNLGPQREENPEERTSEFILCILRKVSGENVRWCCLWWAVVWLLEKLKKRKEKEKMELPYSPAILLLGVHKMTRNQEMQ